jgi:hypothetical protein
LAVGAVALLSIGIRWHLLHAILDLFLSRSADRCSGYKHRDLVFSRLSSCARTKVRHHLHPCRPSVGQLWLAHVGWFWLSDFMAQFLPGLFHGLLTAFANCCFGRQDQRLLVKARSVS